jgi:hypothetical protein
MCAGAAGSYAPARIERVMRTPAQSCTILLILCLASLVAACAPRLDPREDAAVQAVFDQVKHHDFVAIESRLPPLRRTAVTDERLQVEAGLIPDQPPSAVKLVSLSTATIPAGRQTSEVKEYFYPDRMLVVSTAIRSQAGEPQRIVGFNIQPFSKAALAVGRFSLADKSTTQYFLLGLAALIPLLLVLALAILSRDRRTGWKPLWTVFILIGFMQLSVDWTSGAIVFQPLALVLLGASVSRGALDVSPWVVAISLPLGALVYLGRVWFAPRADEID